MNIMMRKRGSLKEKKSFHNLTIQDDADTFIKRCLDENERRPRGNQSNVALI